MGCGGAPTPAPRASTARNAPPIELLALIPDGATVVVHVRPETLSEFGDLRGVVDLVLTPRAKMLFRLRYGVALTDMDEIVVATYPKGELVFLREAGQADAIVRTAAKQLFVDRQSDAPFLRRGGFAGNEPRELAAIHPDVAVACSGDLTPLFTVMDRMKREAAKATADGSSAPLEAGAERPRARDEDAEARTRDTVLAVFAPQPLALPTETPIGLLLAREESVSAIVRTKSPGVLELAVTFHGEFPPGAEDNFRSLVEALATEPWLSALGIERYRDTLKVKSWAQEIQLRGELSVPQLQAGLKTVFVTEIAELVGHLGSD